MAILSGTPRHPRCRMPAWPRLGLNWRYVAFEVHPDNLHSAIQGGKAMNFIGLNLTYRTSSSR